MKLKTEWNFVGIVFSLFFLIFTSNIIGPVITEVFNLWVSLLACMAWGWFFPTLWKWIFPKYPLWRFYWLREDGTKKYV